MNPKHHTSLKIAKQLVEAGIVIESEYGWYQHPETGEAYISIGDAVVHLEIEGYVFVANAPIATEILERLPDYITQDEFLYSLQIRTNWSSADQTNKWVACYWFAGTKYLAIEKAPNLPDALALLLIRLTKDGLI